MPSAISTAWSARRRPSCCRPSSIAEERCPSGHRHRGFAMTEPLAIVPRAHVQMPLERVPHAVLVAEAGAPGDGLDALVRVFEQLARRLQPKQLDGLRRRAAGLRLVDAREVARAHARTTRERF